MPQSTPSRMRRRRSRLGSREAADDRACAPISPRLPSSTRYRPSAVKSTAGSAGACRRSCSLPRAAQVRNTPSSDTVTSELSPGGNAIQPAAMLALLASRTRRRPVAASSTSIAPWLYPTASSLPSAEGWTDWRSPSRSSLARSVPSTQSTTITYWSASKNSSRTSGAPDEGSVRAAPRLLGADHRGPGSCPGVSS